jgi:deazaflavin-dependent oxidoreductase (nitroreductase family)
VFRAPAQLYRWGCGPLLGRRFLLLIHTGRRTGLRRETVLEVMEYRPAGGEAVVMSAFGRHADWLQNIQADPNPEVVIGRRRFVAAYRILDAGEALSVVRGYEQRHRLIAPIVRAAEYVITGAHAARVVFSGRATVSSVERSNRAEARSRSNPTTSPAASISTFRPSATSRTSAPGCGFNSIYKLSVSG